MNTTCPIVFRAAIALLLSTLAVFATPAAAGGCNVYLVKGVLRGDCDLSYMVEKFQGRVDFAPRWTFPLPNLQPDGMHYLTLGNILNLGVEVQNVNAVGSFEHPVVVVFALTQLALTQTATRTVRVPGVPGGRSVTAALTAIDLTALGFTRDDDIDVVAMIFVDPTTAAQPRGEIIESIETDNTSSRACRVYGNVRVNTSVRPCR